MNHIYRIIAWDPAEEGTGKIFFAQEINFEEADEIFTSLMEKKNIRS
jgi:hypothetical protein